MSLRYPNAAERQEARIIHAAQTQRERGHRESSLVNPYEIAAREKKALKIADVQSASEETWALVVEILGEFGG